MAAASQATVKIDIQIADAKRLHIAGELKLAQRKYEKLLKKMPANPMLLSLLGGLLLQRKQYKNAIPYLEKAAQLNKQDADIPYNLALAYYHLKDYKKSIVEYQHAIAVKPAHDRAHYMLARACLESRESDTKSLAIKSLQEDIRITDRLDSHVLLAECFHEDKKNIEARQEAKLALQKDPTNEIALFVLAKTIIAENYTNAQVDIRSAEPVIKAGNLILKLYPNSWRGHHVIGEALAMIGENDLAIQHYKKVNELVPNFAMSRTNTGVLLLKQGRLSEGWEEIGHRKHHGAELYGMDTDVLSRCPAPFWDGEIRAGLKLLVASEQGIGDQFLHCQMIRDLISMGVHVHMTCTQKILPVMTRSIPQVTFYSAEDTIEKNILEQMDFKAELLDLGRYLRSDLDSFKEKFYYLKPDPDLAQIYKQKYQIFGNKLKVGIAWKSISRSVGSIKSTQLMDWEDILRTPGVQFINIQYGSVAEDIQQIKQQYGVEIYQDDFDPFDDIEKAIAQISALDMVISVSNASVHISGQLNIPTWVILNSRPLWHWFENDDRTVWYDSLKLFRQNQLSGWRPVLNEVARALKDKVGSKE